jgi:hypothetical protein
MRCGTRTDIRHVTVSRMPLIILIKRCSNERTNSLVGCVQTFSTRLFFLLKTGLLMDEKHSTKPEKIGQETELVKM